MNTLGQKAVNFLEVFQLTISQYDRQTNGELHGLLCVRITKDLQFKNDPSRTFKYCMEKDKDTHQWAQHTWPVTHVEFR